MTVRGFRPELSCGLAALRIALGITILVSPELWQAPRLAAQPSALRFAPEGLGLVVHYVPIDLAFARVAQALLIACCAAAIAGVAARWAMFGITIAGLYVFGLSQLSGAVIHDMHLFWLSALLSVSPCGDALSLTRVFRPTGEPPRGASLSYGVPLQLARMLLAIVYFFPGFWKLRTSGLAWITSDNLRNQLYWKWFELGRSPPLWRVDLHPQLLHAAALAVVAFELGFILLIWSPRGRLVAALGGLTFHLGTQWLMGVTFVSLLACYVVLLPWDAWLRARSHAPPLTSEANVARASLLVGGLLVAITAIQGARGATQAWPFGCYPTFDRVLGDTIADLRIEAIHADGSVRVVPDGPSTGGPARSSQGWARAWQVAGLYGRAPDAAMLRAYWRALSEQPLAAAAARAAVRLRFYAATYSVHPGEKGAAPVVKRPLGELVL